jgi:diguanylate cyclase
MRLTTLRNIVLGWLGRATTLRPPASDSSGGEPEPEDSSSRDDVAREARRDLLHRITGFLLHHDLDVTPTNLVLVHGALSGENRTLARAILHRVGAGEPVTQSWLEETASLDPSSAPENEERDLEGLAQKLVAALDAFFALTSSMRQATSRYGDDLEQQVSDMAKIEETGQLVASLTALTRAMIVRTREAADEIRQREGEAKVLHGRLERAQRDAEIDYLTGLPNRRAFDAILERHYREARGALEALVVAFCDIDHFKRINDEHGHAAGDRVLKSIAHALSRITDNNCHVARYGGEEFVMLFRDIPIREARHRLDEVREQLAQRRLVNRKTESPFGQITFSGGVADVFAYSDPREALRAADEALSLAKAGGRNQIVIAKNG